MEKLDKTYAEINKKLDLAIKNTDDIALSFGLDTGKEILDYLHLNNQKDLELQEQILTKLNNIEINPITTTTIPDNNIDLELQLKKINNNFNILFGLIIIGICLVIFANIGFNNA